MEKLFLGFYIDLNDGGLGVSSITSELEHEDEATELLMEYAEENDLHFQGCGYVDHVDGYDIQVIDKDEHAQVDSEHKLYCVTVIDKLVPKADSTLIVGKNEEDIYLQLYKNPQHGISISSSSMIQILPLTETGNCYIVPKYVNQQAI